MNIIPADLIELTEWNGTGFRHLTEIGKYSVAVLRHYDGVSTNKISRIERHNATDEIFILTAGKAAMVVFKENNLNSEPVVFSLEINKITKVKKGVWHQVMLSADAHIIIFEKSDTTKENSEYFIPDSPLERMILKKIRQTE
jgi:ureidoglycolate hydrolase